MKKFNKILQYNNPLIMSYQKRKQNKTISSLLAKNILNQKGKRKAAQQFVKPTFL